MIQVKNLSFQYPGAPTNALKNLSLSIEKGSCIGLLGPNGAGKTTLISILSGLQRTQLGEVYFDSKLLSNLSDKDARTISVVPQDFAFYPRLTVWENISFFAALYNIKDLSLLDNILKRVDLQNYKKIQAKNLSGGLKRRLNFAIALVNSPQLIFMDEPTVGVDPQSREFILNNVKKLTQEGVTVIYTSHYLHEIEQICDTVVILDHGVIRFEGNIENILQEYAEASLLIITDKELDDSIHSRFDTISTGDAKGLIKKSVSHAELSAILNALAETDNEILSINFGHGTLEAFYLNLLKDRGETL